MHTTKPSLVVSIHFAARPLSRAQTGHPLPSPAQPLRRGDPMIELHPLPTSRTRSAAPALAPPLA